MLSAYRRYRLRLVRKRFASTPLREAFRAIYRERLWGGGDISESSGSGSGNEWTADYVQAISRLIKENGVELVVDLGCGDFRVGAEIVRLTDIQYVGVDIVPEVIEHHRRAHSASRVRFECLDITTDELPPAPLCLVRQVFQHLSNAEIQAALQNLRRTYKWIIVTEHQPSEYRLTNPNIDKPHGPDTRVVEGSGVFLDRPPFDQRVASILCTTRIDALGQRGDVLQTVVLVADPKQSKSVQSRESVGS